MRACMQACICVVFHGHARTHVYTYIYIYTNIFLCMHAGVHLCCVPRARTHAPTHPHKHTHSHTHTRTHRTRTSSFKGPVPPPTSIPSQPVSPPPAALKPPFNMQRSSPPSGVDAGASCSHSPVCWLTPSPRAPVASAPPPPAAATGECETYL